MPDIDWLLVGPRGRRLCWTLVENALPHLSWRRAQLGLDRPVPGPLVAELADAVATWPDRPPGEFDDALAAALSMAVDMARYWQEPDGGDEAAAQPDVRDALVPVARAAVAAAPDWWAAPVDLWSQWAIEWVDEHAEPPTLTGALARLAAWRAETLADERRASERPRDVRANFSGHWWSTPSLARLPVTTRSEPGRGPVRLDLVEDELGWTAAVCHPVAPTRAPRVFEIAGPDDWVELVASYPLEVTLSRRHDWWRATGREGQWLIPDFQAVAADHDAVHLTVRGYLATAGRALDIDAAATVLAGWSPDETYWLTDCLEPSGEPERWVTHGEGIWVRA